MQPSPLHLENYFFTRIHMDACEDPACQEVEVSGQLKTQTRCQPHAGDPLRWMVTLVLSLDQDVDAACPPYTAEFEVVGFFAVDESFPEERRSGLVQANAPAVLFGAVREMLTNLSSRGPYPPVNLNTVTFIDNIKSTPDSATQEQ